jgi:hypothetical protein
MKTRLINLEEGRSSPGVSTQSQTAARLLTAYATHITAYAASERRQECECRVSLRRGCPQHTLLHTLRILLHTLRLRGVSAAAQGSLRIDIRWPRCAAGILATRSAA